MLANGFPWGKNPWLPIGVLWHECPLPHVLGLLEGDAVRDGGDRREGEAGRPPLGWSAWTMHHWPSGEARDSAGAMSLVIQKLLEEL